MKRKIEGSRVVGKEMKGTTERKVVEGKGWQRTLVTPWEQRRERETERKWRQRKNKGIRMGSKQTSAYGTKGRAERKGRRGREISNKYMQRIGRI